MGSCFWVVIVAMTTVLKRGFTLFILVEGSQEVAEQSPAIFRAAMLGKEECCHKEFSCHFFPEKSYCITGWISKVIRQIIILHRHLLHAFWKIPEEDMHALSKAGVSWL